MMTAKRKLYLNSYFYLYFFNNILFYLFTFHLLIIYITSQYYQSINTLKIFAFYYICLASFFKQWGLFLFSWTFCVTIFLNILVGNLYKYIKQNYHIPILYIYIYTYIKQKLKMNKKVILLTILLLFIWLNSQFYLIN